VASFSTTAVALFSTTGVSSVSTTAVAFFFLTLTAFFAAADVVDFSTFFLGLPSYNKILQCQIRNTKKILN